jgi:hypothetical protein
MGENAEKNAILQNREFLKNGEGHACKMKKESRY